MKGQGLLVVHVFQAMDAGGAELRTLEVLRHVPLEQVRTVIVTLAGRKGELAEAFEALGVEIVPLRLDLTFPVAFFRLLRQRRPAAVHSHVATFSAVPLVIARAAGVPVRIAQFRSTGDRHGNSLRRRVQRRLMRVGIDHAATAILGVSPGALSEGWRAGWQRDPRCAVVPTGVECASKTDLVRRSGPPVVAHVGRSLPEKNRERALSVFSSLVHERIPTAQLLMVGRTRPEEKDCLMGVASRLGVADAVIFTGQRGDVRALLAQVDVLLVTSTREGLPGVILEGLSVGTPCLSADLPGSRYIAQALGGVSLLPLSASDEVWAQQLGERVGEESPQQARTQRRSDFEESAFTATAVARRLVALWSLEATSP